MQDLPHWLTSHGAAFERKLLLLSEIDTERSLKNQARVSAPLQEDTVLLYGVAMEAGQEFPAIVVYPSSDNRYTLIDGNHRVAGAMAAGILRLKAFVVTNATPAMIQVLTYEANTKHGLPTTVAERIQQALHLEASGMSRKEAAESLGVPESRLSEAAQLQRADVRIFKIRRSAIGLGQQIRKRLDNVRNDQVLAAALELVSNSGMSASEVSDLVTEINRQRSENEQMLVIQREVGRQSAKIAATAGGKVQLPHTVVMLDRALTAIDRVDVEKVNADLKAIGEGMKMVYIAKVMDANKKIREIMNG